MNNTDNSRVRVRFAPSPTGNLHVGSFRTALFNWLFARKNGGSFILRVEDTDQRRSRDEFLRSQLADLDWMGLDWDEGPGVGGDYGPYFQMGRLHTYQKFARRLQKEGKAYQCWCTPEELKAMRGENSGYGGTCRDLTPEKAEKFAQEGRKPCLRFRTPESGFIVIDDMIKGEVSFDSGMIDDFVIVKSDGIPTYNFAVVIDDYTMGISHVIRGDEHMSNTPRQVMIYNALDLPLPRFCHIPVILGQDRVKLSKRRGAVHLLDYRDRGFVREALFNFMALLGWSPKDNREIMNSQEIVEAFSVEGITRNPAVFDEQKLVWMNSQYLSSLPVATLLIYLKEFFRNKGIDPDLRDDKWLARAIEVYRDRMKTLEDFFLSLSYFYQPVKEYDPKGIKKIFKGEYLPGALCELACRIGRAEAFDEETLESLVREYALELGISAGKLIQAVRLAVTGVTATPPIFDVMVLAGKDLLITRLETAAHFMRSQSAEQAPTAG